MALRMPNGYGSIIKLSGKRRKPYAVRITTGISLIENNGEYRAKQSFRYLEYFEKRADAIRYLSNYNAGLRIAEHRAISEIPTFAEIYEKVIAERENSKKGLKSNLKRSYNAAFKKFSALHDMKICNIRYSDVQSAVDDNSSMSKSTVNNMLIVAHAVAAYAVKYEYITTDFSEHLTANYRDEQHDIHKPFTHEEIEILKKDRSEPAALFALIIIYTGMRPSELLEATITDSDLSRHYFIGGMKTAAGKNRVIPLHPYIESLIAERLAETGSTHLFPEMSLVTLRNRYWDRYMQSVDMDHLPHDGRHTCATLMEKAGVPLNRRKLILGHKITDITDGVYTHVPPSELVAEISKISP